MAILFDPSEIIPNMQSTFCQRIAHSMFTELQEKFIISIEKKRFLFRITREIVSATVISDIPQINKQYSALPYFQFSKNQWISLTFGYIMIDDIFDEIIPMGKEMEYERFKPILSILYPDLDPVWDYFEPL